MLTKGILALLLLCSMAQAKGYKMHVQKVKAFPKGHILHGYVEHLVSHMQAERMKLERKQQAQTEKLWRAERIKH